MFNGHFAEGQSQTAILEDAGGVVPERSFEALIQWLYMCQVFLDVEDLQSLEQHISAIIGLLEALLINVGHFRTAIKKD